MVITDGGVAKLVIQDIDSYQETQNALAMLKLAALGRRAVEQGGSTNRRQRGLRRSRREELGAA